MTSFQSASLCLLLAAPFAANAVTVYQCENESGERTFQDRCPPGTTPVMETRYGAPAPAASAAAAEPGEAEPALLYVVPNCDSCEQVREFLQFRNVTFTEVDVADNVEMQEQLKQQAGQLRVPAIVIGGRAVVGYDRSALNAALAGAGYAVGGEAPAEAGAEEETAEQTAETADDGQAAEEDFTATEE